jgi:hypothetical protein
MKENRVSTEQRGNITIEEEEKKIIKLKPDKDEGGSRAVRRIVERIPGVHVGVAPSSSDGSRRSWSTKTVHVPSSSMARSNQSVDVVGLADGRV